MRSLKSHVLVILIVVLLWALVFNVYAATASWTAPTTNINTTPLTGPITYQIYIGTKGNEITKGPLVSTTTATVTLNQTTGFCIKVTAINNGAESQFSNEACLLQPNSPTNLTVK